MNRLDEPVSAGGRAAEIIAPDNLNPRRRWAWFSANATVFVSSFSMMVIELVAGRIIARHLGSSLYTWTSIIGVVLGGIAIGNYIGGLLADRFAARRTLAALFVLSSATCASIAFTDTLAAEWTPLWTLSWPMRVASHVALVFFLPSALLGTISPVVAKMALDLGRRRGRTIGSVYAWGVVGSILGTFATGFYLIAAFGTMTVVWTVAAVLGGVALLYGAASWTPRAWAVALAAAIAVSTGPWSWAREIGEGLGLREPADADLLFAADSAYSFVQVKRVSDSPEIRAMYLDKLRHSEINLDDLGELRYEYERTYAVVTGRLTQGMTHVNSLVIGGGGYAFPSHMARKWPGSRTDVAEIDPVVTQAARQAMGLPAWEGIRVFHEDGRVVVDRRARQTAAGTLNEQYDMIYLDVFNDYSVPFQLTTLEFVRNVHGLLTPNGAYLMNLIDAHKHGRLLGAAYATLRQVFNYVYILTEGRPVEAAPETRNTFILVGIDRPLDTLELGAGYSAGCKVFAVSDAQIYELLQRTRASALTDDHAPVENLIAAVVRDSSGPMATDEWRRLGQQLIRKGQYDRAIAMLREGLAHDPTQLPLRLLLGGALSMSGKPEDAIEELKRSLALSETASAHSGLAAALTQLGRHQEALTHREAAIRLSPKDPVARATLADTLARLSRWEEAFAAYAEAVALRPRYAEAHACWASGLAAAGHPEEALKKYDDALRIQPSLAEAQFRRGDLLLKLKRFDEAVIAFREYLKTRPADADAQFNVGNAYYFNGRMDEAAEAYLLALKINPNFQNAYLNVALIREAQGRLDEALRYCEQMVRARPADTEARRLMRRITDKRRGATMQ